MDHTEHRSSTTDTRPRKGPTIVLVAGAWLGGWAWDQVAAQLRERGHDVVTPSLPGMAERAAEDRPELTLQVHVEDLVATLSTHQDATRLLVGHSYAGAVVTGAAAMLEGVGGLVYVDASVPVDDGPLIGDGPQLEAMSHWAALFDGRRLPLLPDEMLASRDLYGADDLSSEAMARFRSEASPFPLPCMTTPLMPGTVLAVAGIPRTFVRCTRSGPPPWWVDAAARRPTDRYVELDAGHWPMWSRPAELAAAIHAAAERTAV